MSKMSELHIEIQELLEDGFVPSEVAEKLEVPIDWVEAVMEDVRAFASTCSPERVV